MTGLRFRWWRPVAGVAAVWLAVVLLDAVHLDLVLPVAVWVATAALLRGRTTVVDRLVLALAALVAAVCVAGLVLSVWPWHLEPVPVAGCALTGLVLISALTGRGFAFRGAGFGGRDAGVLAVGALAAVIGWAPVAGQDATGRLAVVFGGEDLSRHFLIFDWMGRVGGYLFQSGDLHGRFHQGFVVYPQGSHLVAAVLESFRHSGPIDTYTSFSHYVDYLVAAYVFLVVAIAWAVSWVWARRLRPLWAVVTFAAVAALACFDSLVTLITRGYPSQLTGLALFVVLLALAARPLTGDGVSRGQVVLLGALFAGVSFTYYFYLPLAAVAVAAWAWSHWGALRARPGWPAAVAVVSCLLAAVMPVVNQSGQTLSILTYGGPAVSPSMLWLAGLGAVVLAAVAVARADSWRDPVWRTLLVVLVGVLGFIAALVLAKVALGAGVVYYVKKALVALLVVELVLLGGIGERLGAGQRIPKKPVLGVLAAVVVLASTGALNPWPARTQLIFLPIAVEGTSYGRAYAEGKLALPDQAADVMLAARAEPDAPAGRLILFWDAYGRGWDFYAAQWASVLNRRLDERSMTAMTEIPKTRKPDSLERLLASLGRTPAKVVTKEAGVQARVEAFRAAHPEADITVLRLPGECGVRCTK